MGPARIVVDAPRLDLLACILDRRELMHVQALVAEPAVEGFNEGILHGFARPDEIQLHAARDAQSSSARDMNSVP